MCTLGKLNSKISQGSLPPDPTSVLVPLALDPIFCWTKSELLPPALLL